MKRAQNPPLTRGDIIPLSRPARAQMPPSARSADAEAALFEFVEALAIRRAREDHTRAVSLANPSEVDKTKS